MRQTLSDWLTSALKGQEPSGFCFIHFFKSFSVSEQTTCFSARKDFMIREKAWKKNSAYRTQWLISVICNQKLIRTNGGDLFFKKQTVSGLLYRTELAERFCHLQKPGTAIRHKPTQISLCCKLSQKTNTAKNRKKLFCSRNRAMIFPFSFCFATPGNWIANCVQHVQSSMLLCL